ncbi:ER oligosaccharyltransferase complex subunit [Yamadazyma tenuis]|uniref:Subunit of N oligosaccharyltransferase complex n=1 Tax=Candida tenuis (strain ATCC 10573 / BCRC 21748 / CBS 615 / JCM 9827 / NBRC 10315 / NRRL Y-1498 / VKM Y-70) TaxID=590646 RepID=G3BBN2_CANTC|nr:subunit of N oligosaccharyltransferase complex [Yamadazyma tenuis ATCC 10573]XP_006688742.1 uncharacterized protein CANTEDRAFT_115042 [Yamadazyma tenuis ATCC 10573]EGV62571.1 subunit of N oligosaccharyltransferase complex [Yamadazyma tenuis ATCC 10573]EGV62572.1 hypothetical protein CANTEDRAFT_115042 [Yamadazyma tenuis ATCC 10573]WEJ92801.1 ER oligosaccharyltransferase complex subunit [Yamadazyma tenuis]
MVIVHSLVWVLLLGVLVAALSSQEALGLTELSQKSEDFIIRVTDGKLDSFTGVRDYYTLVILTSTSSEHKCTTCQNLIDIVQIVARSWFHDYTRSHALFFVEIDLVHEPNMRLAGAIQLQTVPHLWLVPPNPEEQYDEFALLKEQHFIYRLPVGKVDSQAFDLAQFLSQTLQKSIYIRDGDPMVNFVLYFVVTFLVITICKRNAPQLVKNLGRVFAYKVLSIGMILASTTGFQYSRIQKIPFVARNDEGLIIISGGTHYQFGVESLIVSGVYLLLAVSFLVLVYLGSYKTTAKSTLDDQSKHILIISMTITLYLLYSALTSIILRKDSDYPYAFTKLF